MDTMYARAAKLPKYSFFLFGPRGTGKTTWLREQLPEALWFNLLLDREFLPLLSDAGLIRERILAREKGWVVIDEVQKIPSLLNEVHDLMSLYGNRYQFALSGSSARKLRRMETNLLAGRAIERKFFPLVYSELDDDYDLEHILSRGTLPVVLNEPGMAAEILESYASTYLKEEIQQEALVKNLDSFARFLRVAAQLNGSVLDITNIARECNVGRKSVERYVDTLIDTLVAFRLPAFQPRLKVKERARPKLYFFDCGVVRALTGRTRVKVSDEERGTLLETYLIHELRASQSYLNTAGELSYYGSERSEVDVILTVNGESIAFEIKAAARWRPEFGATMHELLEARKVRRAYGIYRGNERLKSGEITVFPIREFLERLWKGEFA